MVLEKTALLTLSGRNCPERGENRYVMRITEQESSLDKPNLEGGILFLKKNLNGPYFLFSR